MGRPDGRPVYFIPFQREIVVDINLNSKAVEKLIEVVGKGCGILYEPTRIKRKAKAEVDADLIRVNSEIRLDELRLAARSIAERREMRRLENISSIIGASQEHLSELVSDTPVDPDWAANFFNNCQDISDEQMQSVWAKILANEIAQPGSYSLRTLETLKLIRKSDAELFTKICSFSIEIDNNLFAIPSVHNLLLFYIKMGYTMPDFLNLESLGILHMSKLAFFFENEKTNCTLSYNGKKFRLTSAKKSSFDIWALSITGRELFPLCKTEQNTEFLHTLLDEFRQKNIVFEEL